jgi:DNA-binding NtrC family response regulator
MPRIRPLTENERKDRAFQEHLHGAMKAARITYGQLAQILGISVNTLYRKRDNPETLTLREVRILEDTLPGIVIE